MEGAPAPAWALRRETTDSAIEQPVSASSQRKSQHLGLKPVKDANVQDKADVACTIVEFHPNSKTMITAGLDHRVRIFSIDGHTNASMQKPLHFDDYPIKCVKFLHDGSRIIVGGLKPYYFEYDLLENKTVRRPGIKTAKGTLNVHDRFVVSPDDKHVAFLGGGGEVHVVTRVSHSSRALMVPFSVTSMEFVPGAPRHLMLVGDVGRVHIVDIVTRRTVAAFQDDGNTATSCLSWTSDGSLLATGSPDGIVNVYRGRDVKALRGASLGTVKPVKTLSNLVTQITTMHWGVVGGRAVLAFGTRHKAGGMRVYDARRASVVPMWPPQGLYGRVGAMRISGDGGWLVAGLDNGRARMWKIIAD